MHGHSIGILTFNVLDTPSKISPGVFRISDPIIASLQRRDSLVRVGHNALGPPGSIPEVKPISEPHTLARSIKLLTGLFGVVEPLLYCLPNRNIDAPAINLWLTPGILPTGAILADDARGQTVILFPGDWALSVFMQKHSSITLSELPYDGSPGA